MNDDFHVECCNPKCDWKGMLADTVHLHHDPEPLCPVCREVVEKDYKFPPCAECGAMTEDEAETLCKCAGDKDHCHGCELWG